MSRCNVEEKRTVTIIAIVAIDHTTVMAVDRTSEKRVHIDVQTLKTLLKLPIETQKTDLQNYLISKLDIAMEGRISNGLFYPVSVVFHIKTCDA